MRLTVLGCAGSFPGPDAACSAYLVEADGFRLMLDFGTGSLSALQRYAHLRSVDAVLLSHLHCDHMLDACSYVVVRRYAPDGPYPRLPLYAPPKARERMTAAYGGDEGPLDDVYTFHPRPPLPRPPPSRAAKGRGAKDRGHGRRRRPARRRLHLPHPPARHPGDRAA